MAWKATIDLGPDGTWSIESKPRTKEPWTVVYSLLTTVDRQALYKPETSPTRGKRLRSYKHFTITVEQLP